MGTNQSNIQIIAARVRGLAKELLAIASQIEAQAPHLAVNLPRDLFSDLYAAAAERPEMGESTAVRQTVEEVPAQEVEAPKTRHYARNPKRMTECLLVDTAERLGKAQGFCARNDIERSIARTTGRSREDVREAVNRIAERMQITCVKSRSYRYYPRSLRAKIINEAVELLKAS
jgi:hypothetical protein